MSQTVLVWFRCDLRLGDNEVLAGALAHAAHVVPVFVLSGDGNGKGTGLGIGAVGWLTHSLVALDASLRRCGSRLLIRRGRASDVLPRLATECGAESVRCAREWSPAGLAEESEVEEALREIHVALDVTEGSLMVRPDALAPKSGSGSYGVFAPFFNAWEQQRSDRTPIPAPDLIPAPRRWPSSDAFLRSASASPDPTRWWTPGEVGAHRRLDTFVREMLESYEGVRDRPDLDGTSRLSPHIAFGEISPRQVLSAIDSTKTDPRAKRTFIRQVAWREFSAHVVHCHPAMTTHPLRQEFERMPWADDPLLLDAWRAGMTGYPLVDAGMRELAATGWMHNRVRMVAASLLTKHLLIDWRKGLAHFAGRLIDHQVPANVFNWQWVAGSGADAAPYFRIFNPTLQAQRHDPDGDYIRRWIPELSDVPTRWIARPWEMRAEEARRAGVVIGTTYPAPIIEHTEARDRTLAAYRSIRR